MRKIIKTLLLFSLLCQSSAALACQHQVSTKKNSHCHKMKVENHETSTADVLTKTPKSKTCGVCKMGLCFSTLTWVYDHDLLLEQFSIQPKQFTAQDIWPPLAAFIESLPLRGPPRTPPFLFSQRNSWQAFFSIFII